MWEEVLKKWEKGLFTYPKHIDKFQWNTSVLKHGAPFKESFRTNDKLPVYQNTRDFQDYIDKSHNKYVVAFPNLTKDCMLVIPMPRRGKNYATLKDFIDNAPKIQQQEFWKKVANVARKCMNEWGEVWISVHGLGVPYTHVRIDSTSKYNFL
jgi:hypothetical protein